MSDRPDRKDAGAERARDKVEPEAGRGARSLANWQNLARVRQSLSSKEAQEQYRLDPAGYMLRFGIDMVGLAPQQGESPMRLSVEAQGEGPEMQLAFCKVWGCVIVVAGAAAAAVANAAAGANALVVANANLTANVNGSGEEPEPGDYPTPDPDNIPV